ncbi:MAG: PrsW family intramembrane metalloprotease [Candidatus Marinimicrobia bacterium]|nr:PrsW family intramembrane metalloprotease [Candidatus Neomarinimicrobiota bacterium]
MDSYKLMDIKTVVIAIIIGSLSAVVSYFVNDPLVAYLSDKFVIDIDTVWTFYSRYGAPFVEEFFKGFILVYLIRTNKIGFNIDAAIYGFGLGAGFAIIENLYYVYVLATDTNLTVFIIRGFGTAVMHGGTMTLFAMIAKTMTDRKVWGEWGGFIPGFLTAVVFHSFYNHFFFNPLILTLLNVITIPVILMIIFKRSEKFLQNWLGVGFDSDQELLDMVNQGKMSDTKVGEYLQSIKDRFPGEAVFDMICLLRIHLELSMRAKGVLMMREAGVDVEPDEDLKDKFNELHFLEDNIGKTGMMALGPFLHQSSQDLWQLHMLGKEV